jgi:hypothetical protein
MLQWGLLRITFSHFVWDPAFALHDAVENTQ